MFEIILVCMGTAPLDTLKRVQLREDFGQKPRHLEQFEAERRPRRHYYLVDFDNGALA